MERKRLQQLQDRICKEIDLLESDALSLPNNDTEIDQLFKTIEKHLHNRYQALKNEATAGSSSSEMLRKLHRLKEDALSEDQTRLKQVHMEVSELKTEMLFAPSPPKIDIGSVLAAIDNISIGPNDRSSPPPPARDPVSRSPHRAPFSTTPTPFSTTPTPFSTTPAPFSTTPTPAHQDLHRAPFSTTPVHQDPDYKAPSSRSSRHHSQSSDKHTARDSGRDFDTRSERYALRGDKSHDSQHSQYRASDNDVRQSTSKPAVFSPTLLTPADFSASQNTSQHTPLLTNASAMITSPPARRALSPIGPRSPPPRHHRSSTPAAAETPTTTPTSTPTVTPAVTPTVTPAKSKFHYFNPVTKTIETRDSSITPERPPQNFEPEPRRMEQRLAEQRSRVPHIAQDERSRAPHVQEEHTRAPHIQEDRGRAPQIAQEEQTRAPQIAQEEPSWTISSQPMVNGGPKIEDMCKNKTIKRYFTEFTDCTNPLVANIGTVEELYNPTCLFIKSEKVDNHRDNIQIKVAQHVESLAGFSPQKSHPLGKLILCRFSRDGLWYRACVYQQHPEHYYTVLFVDYGNKEEVHYKAMYDLPQYLQYEVMCVQQCYLANIAPADPRQDVWDAFVTEALWEMVSGRRLRFEVQLATNKIYGVKLFIAGAQSSINQTLVEMGYARNVEVESVNEDMKGLCTSPMRFTSGTNISNAHTTSAPSRGAAVTPRRVATPPRRAASPPRRAASPPRRAASPPRRAASPPRRAASPPRRAASPPPTKKPGRCRSPVIPPTRAPQREPQRTEREPQRTARETPSSSSQEETPSVGRPPSFGSAQQPFGGGSGGSITSPPKSSFGTPAVGRGSAFGDNSAFTAGPAKGRGNLKNFEFNRFG